MAEVTEEIKAQAAASVKRAQAKREESTDFAFGKSRVRRGANKPELTVSDISVDLDPDGFGPTAFSANLEGDIAGFVDQQEFSIDETRATKLHFTAPGQRLPKKTLYTVKAFHKDGRLVQLPFEEQIQNTAGGDPQDALGLRRYQNKGMVVLIDWDTLIPIYCAAWDCWAKATNSGFCSSAHQSYTLPNANHGVEGVTTSRVWNG
jgi:hypothetical protein